MSIVRGDEEGMNLKQLETFLQIVQQGSFGAAAQALHTTQSTVSARLKDLEHDLGVQLFDRTAHRAQLTPQGRELFDGAQEFIGALDALRGRIANSHALGGVLRLGVVGVVAGTWLPALVRELRTRHPALELQIELALTKVLTQKLRAAELDVAIVAGTVEDDSLRSEVVGDDRFAWMASPALKLSAQVVTPRVLAGHPLIGYPAESYHHGVMKSWFKTARMRFHPTITCNSMEVMAKLVGQGVGIAFLPQDYYASDLALGRMDLLAAEPSIAPVEFTLLTFEERQTVFARAVMDAVQAVRKRTALAS